MEKVNYEINTEYKSYPENLDAFGNVEMQVHIVDNAQAWSSVNAMERRMSTINDEHFNESEVIDLYH